MRRLISSGSTFERDIGFSRAVVDGDWVFVSGTTGFDYEAMTTEEWLANCSACCVPEIGGALTRAHIAYKVISGALFEDEHAWGEIEAWCRAAG